MLPQEHERVVHEEVHTAAALATTRTAAQRTSRFRDIECNAEASFNQQQRGWIIYCPIITAESAQGLEAQRHSLIREATAEMMRRDTRQEEVLSQFVSDLQYYHHHAEGQSEELQQFQAELGQKLQRSNAAGVQTPM